MSNEVHFHLDGLASELANILPVFFFFFVFSIRPLRSHRQTYFLIFFFVHRQIFLIFHRLNHLHIALYLIFLSVPWASLFPFGLLIYITRVSAPFIYAWPTHWRCFFLISPTICSSIWYSCLSSSFFFGFSVLPYFHHMIKFKNSDFILFANKKFIMFRF